LLTLLGASTACDDVPQTCEEVVTLRKLTANGLALNGLDWLGVSLNGLSLNSIVLNGIMINGIVLNGTQLDVQLDASEIVGADGTPFADAMLVGTEIEGLLSGGTTIALRIDGVRREGGLTYYALSHDGANVSSEGLDGLFVPGSWDAAGALVPTRDAVSYSCTNGVLAKCVRWGYAPWDVGAQAHQSCTRMARADYCGDGVPHTRNGTAIDVFDDLGVQDPIAEPGAFEFEAAWGPDGATCVSRPRFDEEVVGVGEVLPSCWDELPRCDSLAEATSLAPDAAPHLANRSVPEPRLLCEARRNP
jgi:hypothetical protein